MSFTPLLNLGDGIWAKAEYANPTGSIKDRLVSFLLREAFEHGELKRGMTVTEATSGNTGISLAYFSARLGLKAKIFMSKNSSLERKKIIRMLGAELELTDLRDEATEKAEEFGAQKGVFYLNQFESKSNPLAHYYGTGLEILKQFGEKINSFVVGVGTGGTIYGAGQRLKERWPKIEIIGVLPAEKENLIEGLRPEFSARVVPEKFIDRIVKVKNKDAVNEARELIQGKGVLAGISSGANYFAAKKFGFGNTITVLPDSWDRYYSTSLFDNN